MPILNPEASQTDVSSPAHPSIALLPLTAVLAALTTVFADRFTTTGRVALVVLALGLIAATGAAVARATARTAADRARRDADVLDAPEPLAGARR